MMRYGSLNELIARYYRRLDLKLHQTKKKQAFGMDYCMHSNMALTMTKLSTHPKKIQVKKHDPPSKNGALQVFGNENVS